jgi:hypothetical protein
MYQHQAYLVVICDPETNRVLAADTWSSPEWGQSRQLPQRVYILYQRGGRSYHEAQQSLLEEVARPDSRYHWVQQHLPKEEQRSTAC